MQQQISFITLGVNNLTAMRDFYVQTFGWIPFKESDSIVFFQLNGFILGLFPADELAADIGITNDGDGFKRMSLAMNFKSTEEVDQAFNNLITKGARSITAPEAVFWGGYSGYFQDPDGHLWEIVWNPQWSE